MSELSDKKRFEVLCQISRAQHFAWRAAVAELVPAAELPALVDRMWAITGEKTGAAYARRLDLGKPLAPQLARSFVWSSDCMGEEAEVLPGEVGEAFVRHGDCPWFHWHKRLGLAAEDRPGCDAWFAATIECVNRACDVDIKFETLETLPDGDSCCLRRVWE